MDIAKGIGICLVILGHNENPLTNYIYSFHMPLFFLLAGIFHSSKSEYSIFLKNKTKALLVPYFSFSIILFLFWMVIGRKFGEATIKNTPISHSLFGILIGRSIDGISSTEWGPSLWFLPCIFLTANLFYFIGKLSKKYIVLINILFIGLNIILSRVLTIDLPWSLPIVSIALPFYSFGYLFKDKIQEKKIDSKYLLGTLLLFILSVLTHKTNGKIEMSENEYNNILLFLLAGVSGSLFLINIVKLIPSEKFKWMSFLGVNTLILLAFHAKAMTIIKLIWVLILKQELVEGTLPLSIFYSLIQVLLLLPLIVIINRWMPFTLGKFKKQL